MPTSHYNLGVSPEEAIQAGVVPGDEPAAAVSPEAEIIAGVVPVVESVVEGSEVVETVVSAPPPVVAPVIEDDEPGDPNLVKTSAGWEYRVDLGDGSGVQVFKGKTQKQVIAALGKAQVNASKKIRQQEQQNRLLIANEPAEIEEPQTRFKPRALTADEQWEISQNLSDPSKASKALDKYFEIRVGGSIEQVIEKITNHDDDLEFRRARNEALAFIRETPEFYNSEENGLRLANYIEEKGWASTKRNLRKAFVILTDERKLEQRPSDQVLTPEVEEVSTTSSREAAVPVTEEPAAAVPVAKPVSAEPAKPAGLPEGSRVRPGSSSTGMSPRQSSVRTGGATPATPVGLTAEEYHKIPTATIKLKYKTDATFKASVDKLLAEGKI